MYKLIRISLTINNLDDRLLNDDYLDLINYIIFKRSL